MAKALKLPVQPIAKWTKLQNRALRRALDFGCEERTPAVEEFLSDLQGEFTAEERLKKMQRSVVLLTAGFFILGTLIAVFLLR